MKTYNALKIDLTPYKVDEEYDFKWHFTEKNSRVRFTVSLGLLSYYDADSWDLDRYTEYLETGIFETAPDISTSTESMDNHKTDNSFSDVEKEQRNELLIDIVERAYSGRANDEEILHPEFFYKEFYKVLSNDNDYDSWANVGYWKYNDGHLHSYHINGVWENEGQVYVMVYLEDIEQHDQIFGDIHDVGLNMFQYNGKWYITDICGFSKDYHLVYAMSDMIHYLL